MDEIRSLLKKYMEDKKYISCLEELYVLFEKNNISYAERMDFLKLLNDYNMQLYTSEKQKASELEVIEKKKTSIQDVPASTQISIISENKRPKKKVEHLNIDVKEYIDNLKKLYGKVKLEEILPDRDNIESENIINSILVNLYKEKVETINFIRENEADMDEISSLFEDELDLLDSIMESLIDYKNNTEINSFVSPTIDTTNRIIFMKNSSNEPMIFQNIKGYEEYYDSFLELLESIVDGTFKNMRVFVNNNKLTNMIEVKDFKTRIQFTRLKDNIFVIISAFIKKCDTDLRHRNFISNCSQNYQSQKNELLNNIEDEDYMNKEAEFLEELRNTLKGKKKVKKHEVN